MRSIGRTASAVVALTMASGPMVVEGFMTVSPFPSVVHNLNSDKLRFGTEFSSPGGHVNAAPTTLRRSSRRKRVVPTYAAEMKIEATASLRLTRTTAKTAFRVRSPPTLRSTSRNLRSRGTIRTIPCSTSNSYSSSNSGGGDGDRDLAGSDESPGLFQENPLSRDEPERARINNFITILVETPMSEWKPAIVDEYMPSLLKGSLYAQTMGERIAKVRTGENREALMRVDAYLTGFLSQERRRASRKKVSVILSAATEGPMQLDDCVQTLGKADLLDSDLTDYVATLVTAEANRGDSQSTLLKVLKSVRDRIQAELKTEGRPEIRTLARALQIEDAGERKKYLETAFSRLEDLDEFVKFMEEGIEYMGNDFGFALRSNMPQTNFDKMKAVYAEAAAIRRSSYYQ